MAALVAGGLMVPISAKAASTGVNLIVNPGFENVDLQTTSYYEAPKILDWTYADPTPGPGFAYSHDSSGALVPDFANGKLPSGGHWYFTPGNFALGTGSGHDSPANALTQNLDVSTGETGAAIASGRAKYDLRAYFSTYSDQGDYGVLQADFLDGSSSVLGSVMIGPPGSVQDWTLYSSRAPVPVGTATVRISSYGIAVIGSADGYMDNTSFMILPVGDFNNDGLYNCVDVDGLVGAIASGTNTASFDLTGDGLVNTADRDAWLLEAGEANIGPGRAYKLGDANLDGFVDGSDFGIWNANKFTSVAKWCSGDFTANGSIDGSDFGVWNANKFTSSDSAAFVPEPGIVCLGIGAIFVVCAMRRR
jgi:hypothetical protein